MALFKCKMCGGALEIQNNETVATCEYCGTQQTLPKLDDDKRANMYDRANHFRRNNEFDKAMGIYEQILNEDNTDAETYWSLVLCRYGIEYVEDPTSHKRVPTVNRAQFTSIFDDDNYKLALQYADVSQKTLYEEEAETINKIQKGILAISQKEEPFDVFICYKETDNSGRRTQDSVLANDLYHQLSQEGFKVFFSRITLEDKLGTAYEPYIFAALNSAKVMVVLGTKPEFFNAVWVKNEWSRYLSLIKNGAKKMLIPAYKDMDPYDLPEEFSHLQAQDMSKLGFMQDLIRGIKKITQTDVPKTTVVKETVISGGNANTAPLLKRAFMFLEDEDWNSADEYCEKVLDIDPENASAYLGKLMADLKVKKREQLKNCSQPFNSNNNYQKAMRFGDEQLKSELIGYVNYINECNKKARLDAAYNSAKKAMEDAAFKSDYQNAAHLFTEIGDYKDAATLAQECLNLAEIAGKNSLLEQGNSKMNSETISDYEKAIEIFEKILGWKDADEKIVACKKKIEEIKAKEESDRLEALRKAEEDKIAAEKAAKKRKKIFAIGTLIVCVCIAVVIIARTVVIPTTQYNAALALMNDKKYNEAIEAFEALNGYKDSNTQIENCYIGKFGEQKWNQIKNIEIGDTYTFGSYEQDNDTSNGKEAIEWTVLDRDGLALLLISKQSLDCQPYNTTFADVNWEDCSLRKWLNSTFLNTAFSTEEQAQIQNTDVPDNYNADSENATIDKVFLLDSNEAEEYFISDNDRRCKPTKYATTKDSIPPYLRDTDWWWLRLSRTYDHVDCVHAEGNILYSFMPVSDTGVYVRPALWIDMNS